jgi:hypothetical protein
MWGVCPDASSKTTERNSPFETQTFRPSRSKDLIQQFGSMLQKRPSQCEHSVTQPYRRLTYLSDFGRAGNHNYAQPVLYCFLEA